MEGTLRLGGRRRATTLVVIALVALLASNSSALTVAPWTPAQVASQSTAVVIATVDDIRFDPRDRLLVEVLDLKVHEVWKGQERDSMELARLVAVRRDGADRWAYVQGHESVVLGRTYLFFLDERSLAPRLPMTVAGTRGLFEARSTDDGWAFLSTDGRRVVRVGEDAVEIEAAPSDHLVEMVPGPGARLLASPRPASWATSEIAAAWRAVVEARP